MFVLLNLMFDLIMTIYNNFKTMFYSGRNNYSVHLISHFAYFS